MPGKFLLYFQVLKILASNNLNVPIPISISSVFWYFKRNQHDSIAARLQISVWLYFELI